MKPKNWFLGSFSEVFDYALLRPMSYASFFAKWKVSWRYIIVVSPISIAFVVVKLWIFKCLRNSKNLPLQAASGLFSGHNSPKCGQILLKFGTVMQCNIKYHIYYGFWYSLENSRKLSQKTWSTYKANLKEVFSDKNNAKVVCTSTSYE